MVSTTKLGTNNDLYEYSFQKCLYDQTTYFGRFMHFQRVVDPRNFFATRAQLEEA